MNSSKKGNSNSAATASQYGCPIQATSDLLDKGNSRPAGVPKFRSLLLLGKEPRAIPIVKLNENDNFECDSDALEEIFCHREIKHKKVSIISLCGAFRGGKSFMLNYFLHFLKEKGNTNPKWTDNVCKTLKKGFEWRGGTDSCTLGIHVWSEVFFIKTSGQEVAVMLMDTHGLHEVRDGPTRSTIICALSILMSSVQIFNLSQKIQGDDLAFLELFIAFAKARAKTESSGTKPFQKLLFLVRDWANKREYTYGMGKDSKKYLENILEKLHTMKKKTYSKMQLSDFFSDIECCLLPHPGLDVAEAMKTDDIMGKTNQDFTDHMASFVACVLKPENIVTKKICGNEVEASFLARYMEDSFTSFTETTDDSKTMLQVMVAAQNSKAQILCSKEYFTYMEEKLQESFISESSLENLHKTVSEKVLEDFEKQTTLGEKTSKKDYRRELKSEIALKYNILKNENQIKKYKAESDASTIVQTLKKRYEEEMEEAGKASVGMKGFRDLHLINYELVVDEFASNDSIPSSLKPIYFERLIKSLNQSYGNIAKDKEENESIKEAKKNEQEMNEQKILRSQLLLKMEYREKLRKETESYIDERILQNRGEKLSLDMKDMLAIETIQFGLSKPALDKHQESLSEKLKAEFKNTERINEENKEYLKTQMELHLADACVKYDKKIVELLYDRLLSKKNIREKHEKIKQELMENLKTICGYDERKMPAFVRTQLEQADEVLSDRYSHTAMLLEQKSGYCIIS